MSGCDCSGNAGLNGQSFNSYNQPMVSPMSDMGSFGSAEIYNSPSYGMGGNRNNDAYNIDLTGTQPQINYQMAQQQNQPPANHKKIYQKFFFKMIQNLQYLFILLFTISSKNE